MFSSAYGDCESSDDWHANKGRDARHGTNRLSETLNGHNTCDRRMVVDEWRIAASDILLSDGVRYVCEVVWISILTRRWKVRRTPRYGSKIWEKVSDGYIRDWRTAQVVHAYCVGNCAVYCSNTRTVLADSYTHRIASCVTARQQKARRCQNSNKRKKQPQNRSSQDWSSLPLPSRDSPLARIYHLWNIPL
jgi:hypothetical protein